MIMDAKLIAFRRLLTIMDELRAQCPWDKKQTFESLRQLTIEETYELSDAILKANPKLMKEELGDILLHIVFYTKIADEQHHFSIEELINSLCDKLVFRHPHIYANPDASLNDEDVKRNWEQLKMKEGRRSVLEGVPMSLPSINKAYRIQEKAKQVGFEWEDKDQVWQKVEEELNELRTPGLSKEKMEEELGDVLFSIINYARFIDIDPDAALERCNTKFINRFQYIENKALQLNRNLNDMSLQEMDQFWNEAKLHEKQK